MAKQITYQRYVYKINSSRLRNSKWNLTLPIKDARRNDEIVSLSDSQVLRWLDELNGVEGIDIRSKEIRKEIWHIRKEPSSIQNRRAIKSLYAELDSLQFKEDYLCLVIDKEKDYSRACNGFSVNGVSYKRLLGTNGGIKDKTVVFVSERHIEEIRRRIENDRDLSKEMVPAKLEAYKALTCSASTPVSYPNGVLVVNDCETKFISDIIYINDEGDGEPLMENRNGVLVELNESDGYGLMSPELASRWGEEIGIDYLPSGFNTRFAWEKGMVFCFDFMDFADNIAKNYIVKDAWGHERDIREIDLILTTSMVKLWDSYNSYDDYIAACKRNGYTFGISKTCPEKLESERNMNYQFLQSYDLSNEDIDKLISPTINEINDILHSDWKKTVIFLKGNSVNKHNIGTLPDDYAKAIMINPEMLNDPYVKSKVHHNIKNIINEAKVGVIRVHGNYSIVSGDPFSLCQSIFNMDVTGILTKGEIYNEYWANHESERLACYRAPMTCHNNIRSVSVNKSEEARYWYRYMKTCTVFNSWDTASHALNGMD